MPYEPLPSEPPDHRIGQTIAGRYRIDRLLGEGGMGRVYAAEHVAMRKRMAVKVLRRQLTTVPEVVARFEREAMAAANIDHPNIAAATDFGKVEDGSFFLVLEYVEGRSLRDEIAEGPMPVERALRIARQIASALASAHALDIVHRDLKPENIHLVEKAGDPDFVKVLDFGIARVPIGEPEDPKSDKRGKHVTRAGMVFGTPEYMPPEQALGQPVDGRADIYALGVIAYEMMAGRRPFVGEAQSEILGQQLQKPPPPIAEVAPGVSVPAPVEGLLGRLLAREAAGRPDTAGAVAAAIDALLGVQRPGTGGQIGGGAGSVPDGFGSYSDYGSVPGTGTGSVPDSGGSGPGSTPDLLQAAMVTSGTRGGPGPAVPSSPGSAALETGSDLQSRGSGRAVPIAGLLALMAVVVLVLAGVVYATVGSTDADASGAAVAEASNNPENAVSENELKAAKQRGVEGLRALSAKQPKDTSVLLELAKAYELEKNPSAAVATIGNAIAVDPEARNHPSVASMLWRAAQTKDARDAAFALLEGPMLEKGADIIYDLVITEGIRHQVVGRAEKWLESDQFQKQSSPELNIAVALRHAKQCEQIHALLLRAKSVGDERSLKYLRRYEVRGGCGPSGGHDCYPCLRDDSRLAEAIEAIEAREQR